MLMETAEVVARRGTCARLQVGAVFSREGRILSTGYNGAPSGVAHCEHGICICKHDTPRPLPIDETHTHRCIAEDVSKCRASHAERNGIDWAARHGVALLGSTLHCTDSPCLSCAGSILNAGVERVVYRREYRMTDGLKLLEYAGVFTARFERIAPDARI